MSLTVVKVGSNVLSRPDGHPDITHMSMIADQLATLMAAGERVVLVSSGAVACGRSAVAPGRTLDAVASRQLYSAVGQPRLMSIYQTLLGGYGITVGQVLTQKDDFDSRSAYLNQRACIATMLQAGVLPIVNENDTTSMTELMFTDNDELSGLIASMLQADTLVILSNIDGLYTGDPALPGSRLIPVVEPGSDMSDCVARGKSGFGRGGMGTKHAVASQLQSEGVAVYIANGTRPGILPDIVLGPHAQPCTLFAPSPRATSGVKRWIAHSGSFTKGGVRVDSRAAEALCSDRAVSLLPVGVTAVEGDWEEGDIIGILHADGSPLAVGRACTDSATARAQMGSHGGRPIVHYDYLYITHPR